MAQGSALNSRQLALYGEIYRCEACSNLTDPTGVQPFASRLASQGQTVPVSHFGNIETALIWLLVTNPKGNRSDPNVGLGVRNFASDRASPQGTDIPLVFEHFSNYDFAKSSQEFFGPWRMVLDGLVAGGKEVRFDSGGICAVDLIKCPTQTAWLNYVQTDEGKLVWRNCHALEQKGNEFLVRQIELHSPPILLLPGTKLNGKGYTAKLLGKKNKQLEGMIDGDDNYVRAVRSLDNPRRLALELGGARDLRNVVKDRPLLTRSRLTIQRIIDAWSVATPV